MKDELIEQTIWTADPVRAAVWLFDGTIDNRRLWGWYCRELGVERFRELVYQKWCENKAEGTPRNPPTAFQSLLTKALPTRVKR